MSDLKGKRCVIFVQSATDDPDQLDQQAEGLRHFAAQKGLKVQNVARVSTPKSDKSRRQAMSLLDPKRSKSDYDVLLVTSLDRLGFDKFDVHRFVSELQQHGVRVVTLDGFDSAQDVDTHNWIYAVVRQWVREVERKERSKRAKEAWERRRRRGGRQS